MLVKRAEYLLTWSAILPLMGNEDGGRALLPGSRADKKKWSTRMLACSRKIPLGWRFGRFMAASVTESNVTIGSVAEIDRCLGHQALVGLVRYVWMC